MRVRLRHIAALAGLGVAAAAAVVFLGLYDVSARKGHYGVVSWLLHTTYENAVELRADAQVPDLSVPGLADLGAGHFASACAFCHGLPDRPRPATALAMNPVPPHVSALADDFDAAELHWVIYEGVKMSGMPAWPAAREDEVWALVAYLQALATPAPEPAAGTGADPALAFCATCHGANGRGVGPLVPRLDIQTEAYLRLSLAAYREGTRASGFMQDAARRVEAEDLARLARHYADRAPGQGTAPDFDADLIARGRELAGRGTDDVPACTACHGPTSKPLRETTPRLAGQHQPYLAAQLRLWRAGGRGGGVRAELMRKSALDLTDADIAALSAWYASLAPTDPAQP